MLNFQRYRRVPVMNYPEREWPNKQIEKAPIWCSVDLRDGNQALIEPMTVEEKVEMFNLLVKLGFKEIEVGFPSASQIEFDFMRELVDRNLIPEDVTVQVLVQCREHLIKRTFEALDGGKKAIVHIYNSTSTLQRDVVFNKGKEEIKQFAIEGTEMVKSFVKDFPGHITLEYSPESFTGTELEYALEVCTAVQETWGATKEEPIIINLPATVEMTTPNVYADQIEWMHKNFKNRESVILSIHPHNDRGTGVAATELALLAGADRVEGTLFGNGERTGNLDILTVAYNMFSQGINPELDLTNIVEIQEVYERCCKMEVPMRHPYAGKLVFTAFSGSHQDAINKGKMYMKNSKTDKWEVPYLPIDPADVGREYEPIIRINSQSGKGGAAFILASDYGIQLPKAMHPEFGAVVKKACDEKGKELKSSEVFELFEKEYRQVVGPYRLVNYKIYEEKNEGDYLTNVKFEGTIKYQEGESVAIDGVGSGPIGAFCDALNKYGLQAYDFCDYSEHAISIGSDSKAISYIHLKNPQGKDIFGIGVSHNISYASMKGIVSAINRDQADVVRDASMPGIL